MIVLNNRRSGVSALVIGLLAVALLTRAEQTIQVNVLPQDAIDSGAQWRVGTGPWQDSGTILLTEPGDYLVSFKPIIGRGTPSIRQIEISADQALTLTTSYTSTGNVATWGHNGSGQCDVPSPNRDFVAVAGGGNHSLGLKSDGSVVAWGDDTSGQASVPLINGNFVAVAAGGNHSIGLKSDGSVVLWGDNTVGQATAPVPNSGFIAIDAGRTHSLGLKADGSIVAWGQIQGGAATLPSPNIGFVAIAAGQYHSLGLRADGTIVAWGPSQFGGGIPEPNSGFSGIAACGLGSLGLKRDGSIVIWGDNFLGEGSLPEPNNSYVAASKGYGHSLGLKADGTVVSSSSLLYSGQIIPIPPSGFFAISAGDYHNLGLIKDNLPTISNAAATATNEGGISTLSAVLSNTVGTKLTLVVDWGDGKSPDTFSNVSVGEFSRTHVYSKDTGGSTATITVRATDVNGLTGHATTMVAVANLPPTNVALATPGKSAFIGFAYTNTLTAMDVPFDTLTWRKTGGSTWLNISPAGAVTGTPGADASGTQFLAVAVDDGDGGTATGNFEIEMEALGFLHVRIPRYSAVAAGAQWRIGVGDWRNHEATVPIPPGDHLLNFKPVVGSMTPVTQQVHVESGVTATVTGNYGQGGNVVAWGSNSDGQCDVPTPNNDIVAVDSGGFHGVGLKSDGAIVTWGKNDYGQRDIPAPNSDFISVSAGYRHSLGLKANGSIVAWGSNDKGQLNIPLPNTNFVAVVAGSSHSVGLRKDGSIVAWGYNLQRQCNVPAPNSDFVAIAAGGFQSFGLKANGSIVAWGEEANVPAPNSDFIAIDAEGYHSLGLKADGSIVVWGNNFYGQSTVPASNEDFVAVSGGTYHSLGLTADGSIICWGRNSEGQSTTPTPNSGFVAISGGYNFNLGLRKGDHPTISDLSVTATTEGGISTLFATLTDAKGGGLDVTVDWGDGADLEHVNDVPAGTFSNSHVYADDNPSATYTIILSVVDKDGLSDSATTLVYVAAVNDPPRITSVPVTTATEGVVYSYQVEFVDPDGSVGEGFTFSIAGQPDGMSISNSGLITWTPQGNTLTTGNITVTVADIGDSETSQDAQTFSVTVQRIQDAPITHFSITALSLAGQSHTVNFGAWTDATAGFNINLDDLPAANANIWLIDRDGNSEQKLSADFRTAATRIYWRLFVKPLNGPGTLSWNNAVLPAGYGIMLQPIIDEFASAAATDLAAARNHCIVNTPTQFIVAMGTIEQQSIVLERGWNWISMPLISMASLDDFLAPNQTQLHVGNRLQFNSQGSLSQQPGAILPERGTLLFSPAGGQSAIVTGIRPDGIVSIHRGWNAIAIPDDLEAGSSKLADVLANFRVFHWSPSRRRYARTTLSDGMAAHSTYLIAPLANATQYDFTAR